MGNSQASDDIKAPKSRKVLYGILKDRSIQIWTHMYCQMLQRGPQRFRPFREGVHHRGACILERKAVQPTKLTEEFCLFPGEVSLDAEGVKAQL